MTERLLKWKEPLALLVIAFFSYGIFAFQHGFHWDDWGFVWLIRSQGIPGFSDYFATSRPFLTYIYSITTALLGTTSWAWQLFSLLLRWSSAVCLFFVLNMIWPDLKRQIFLVAVFFLIYPGFNQQAVAITYSHFFLVQAGFFLSLILMFWFSERPSEYWWACLLALALSAINLFSIEYFFGLELLRLLLLLIFMQNKWPSYKIALKRAIVIYSPFLFIVLWFLYWRFTFESGYQLELVADTSISLSDRLMSIPITIFEQLEVAGWQAWLKIFHMPDFSSYGPRLTIVYSVMFLLIFIILYQILKNNITSKESNMKFSLQWIGLGIISMVLAGIPFIVGEFPLRLTFPNSRFTLPFALGASLSLVAILELLSKWKYHVILACLLATLTAGTQFNNSYLWREDWKLQRSFFWQIVWRIPDMHPGTIMLSSDTPFDYSSDNSLTFPLNLIYDPDNRSNNLSYAYQFVSVRLGNEIASLKPGVPIKQDYYAAIFESDTDHILAVHYSPPGCFRVLHPVYDRDLPLAPATGEIAKNWLEAGVPILPRTATQALPLSNLEQISSIKTENFSILSKFGTEPTHSWCYYFENADLARQADDWERVATIGDQVFAIPFFPDDLSEYLPFIEAYARTGRWEDARDLTRKTSNSMPILEPALCALWQRVESDPISPITLAQVEKMKNELHYCPYP